jgi:hypothetical protein
VVIGITIVPLLTPLAKAIEQRLNTKRLASRCQPKCIDAASGSKTTLREVVKTTQYISMIQDRAAGV